MSDTLPPLTISPSEMKRLRNDLNLLTVKYADYIYKFNFTTCYYERQEKIASNKRKADEINESMSNTVECSVKKPFNRTIKINIPRTVQQPIPEPIPEPQKVQHDLELIQRNCSGIVMKTIYISVKKMN